MGATVQVPPGADLGGVVTGGKVQPQWGLHLIDVNLVMGNLLDLITSQGRTWSMTHK